MSTATPEWIVENDKIRRPMNCFFVFLSEFRLKAAKEEGSGMGKSLEGQNDISRAARDAWGALSDEEKEPWREKAKRLDELHEETYPDYKYRPLGLAESGLGKKGTKKRERAVREWALRQAAEKEKATGVKAKADKAAKGRQKWGKVVQNVRASTGENSVGPTMRPHDSSGAKEPTPHGVQRSALRRSARQMGTLPRGPLQG